MSAPWRPAGHGRARGRRHRAPAGRCVVVDDEDRENEGDLVLAAAKADARAARRSRSGTPPASSACRWRAPSWTGSGCRRWSRRNEDRKRHGLHRLGRRPRRHQHRHLGGRPRAHDPGAGRLGHRAARAGPARARVPAAGARRAACCSGPGTPRRPSTWAGWPGSTPAGVIAEMVNDDGSMMRLPRLREFADEHGLPVISIADLIDYRQRTRAAGRAGGARPGCRRRTASSTCVGYRDLVDGAEHVALVSALGQRRARRAGAAALRVPHRRRASARCAATAGRSSSGAAHGRRRGARRRGLPARPRGPGIGLLHKLAAYQLQDGGRDTVDAQPRARAARRRPRLRRRRADPRRPRRPGRCGC